MWVEIGGTAVLKSRIRRPLFKPEDDSVVGTVAYWGASSDGKKSVFPLSSFPNAVAHPTRFLVVLGWSSLSKLMTPGTNLGAYEIVSPKEANT
jgi:hypothetical protein